MIKMVAFDFDGTIADTVEMCIEAFKKSVSSYCGHKLTKDEVIKTFGLNEIGMIKAVVNEENWKQALDDFYLCYEKMHNQCKKPFAHILDIIKFLKKNEIIVVLITGKGKKSCNISLEKLGVEKYFTEIMTGEEDYFNKAESIKKLLEKYRVKKDEFYYVGDAASDVTACNEAGVICLSAAWADSADLEKLRSVNSDYLFTSVLGLEKFFESKIGA